MLCIRVCNRHKNIIIFGFYLNIRPINKTLLNAPIWKLRIQNLNLLFDNPEPTLNRCCNPNSLLRLGIPVFVIQKKKWFCNEVSRQIKTLELIRWNVHRIDGVYKNSSVNGSINSKQFFLWIKICDQHKHFHYQWKISTEIDCNVSKHFEKNKRYYCLYFFCLSLFELNLFKFVIHIKTNDKVSVSIPHVCMNISELKNKVKVYQL